MYVKTLIILVFCSASILSIKLEASDAYLDFVGVTPYSEKPTVFKGLDGKTYRNFLSLAQAGGANTVRLGFNLDGRISNKNSYDQARLGMSLKMNVIATIYLSGKGDSFKQSLKIAEAESKLFIENLNSKNIRPALITLGNEINHGKPENLSLWTSYEIKDQGDIYERVAQTLAATARGLRKADYKGDIGIHIDRSWGGFYQKMIQLGYEDFQVMAISLYPKWGDMKTSVEQKIAKMKPVIKNLKRRLLVLETAAPYKSKRGGYATQDWDKGMSIVSPKGQQTHLEKVCDLVRDLPDEMGLGVITWGSDLTTGIHKWDHVTYNRAQVTEDRMALPSLYSFKKYTRP